MTGRPRGAFGLARCATWRGCALMWPGGPGPWLAVDQPLNSEGVRNLDRTFKIQRCCLRRDRGSPATRLPRRRQDHVTGDRRYGVPGHKIANGRHGESQELTTSLMKVLSAFGMGSRGLVDGGGAMERERACGCGSIRGIRDQIDETRVPSAAGKDGGARSHVGVEAREIESYGGGVSWL